MTQRRTEGRQSSIQRTRGFVYLVANINKQNYCVQTSSSRENKRKYGTNTTYAHTHTELYGGHIQALARRVYRFCFKCTCSRCGRDSIRPNALRCGLFRCKRLADCKVIWMDFGYFLHTSRKLKFFFGIESCSLLFESWHLLAQHWQFFKFSWYSENACSADVQLTWIMPKICEFRADDENISGKCGCFVRGNTQSLTFISLLTQFERKQRSADERATTTMANRITNVRTNKKKYTRRCYCIAADTVRCQNNI